LLAEQERAITAIIQMNARVIHLTTDPSFANPTDPEELIHFLSQFNMRLKYEYTLIIRSDSKLVPVVLPELPHLTWQKNRDLITLVKRGKGIMVFYEEEFDRVSNPDLKRFVLGSSDIARDSNGYVFFIMKPNGRIFQIVYGNVKSRIQTLDLKQFPTGGPSDGSG
jgi:hypothetical protein